MALTQGTNCGFVTVAPTTDPGGSAFPVEGAAIVHKHTTPAGVTRITEVGYWQDTDNPDVNFEVALYSDNAGVADVRLFHDATNAKGTGAGWKTVAVDWDVTESTAYWLGLEIDDNTPDNNVDSATSGGNGVDSRAALGTLPDPYGGGALLDADGMFAIYALVEEEEEPAASAPDAGLARKVTVRAPRVVGG